MTRRDFLRRAAIATAGAGAGAVPVGSAYCLASRHEHIVVPNLPAAFDRIRIAVVADVHHGVFFHRSSVEAALDCANRFQPDLVFLLGDYGYHDRKTIPPCIAVLAQIRAPLGIFAVLGNHDIAIDRALTSAELARHKIPELTNRHLHVNYGGSRIRVAGIDDLWEGHPDLDAALEGVQPGECTLLLSHNPDVIQGLIEGPVSFVFSGHTHGGQVHLPVVGSPVVPSQFGQKYRYGLVRGPHVSGYVTSGVGCVFPPVRIGCPPEVACLTLRSPLAVASAVWAGSPVS